MKYGYIYNNKNKCCPHCGSKIFNPDSLRDDSVKCIGCKCIIKKTNLREVYGGIHENLLRLHSIYFPIESGDYGQTIRINQARMERKSKEDIKQRVVSYNNREPFKV